MAVVPREVVDFADMGSAVEAVRGVAEWGSNHERRSTQQREASGNVGGRWAETGVVTSCGERTGR